MSATQESPHARRTSVAAIKLAVRHYLRQIAKDWKVAIPGMLLPGLGSILVFYVPALIIARVLGRFTSTNGTGLGELTPYVVTFGLVWFGGEMLWRVGIHCLIRLDTRGMQRLYEDGMAELWRKDIAFFQDNFAGSLTKKALAYARMFEGFSDTISFNVVGNLLPLVFVVAVLWRFSPWLVLTLVVMLALTAMLVIPLVKRRMRLVVARETASNVLAGHVSDSIMNIDAVRAFAREPHEAAVHARNVGDYIAKAKRSWDYQNRRIDMVTSPMYVLTNVFGLLIAIAIGGRSGLSFEAVFVTFSFYANTTQVMWEFNRIYRNFESTVTEAAQFTELLLEQPTVNDPVAPAVFAPRDASIEMNKVTFRYSDGAGEHLFRDFDLRIASGEKVGLVGRSGGGKSTVTRLLLRFMDIERGEILIGGQNVAAIAQADLRSMIAYVPQDPVMFHRSLADNIRYGRLDATEAEVREAARLAHAAEFIEALPSCYDTLIGERGVKLSGGQRQRVAIARAMVRNAPILLLDEATSSLDSEAEALIQEALWRLMEGRTAIVIAHRLSTVQRMDRLVVLDAGEVEQQGSHADLLALGGTYATLWTRQSGGFLMDEPVEEGALLSR
ncbi:MAG TPA: ABC transporter ATP-binding protein [Actinomycetota bacterium]